MALNLGEGTTRYLGFGGVFATTEANADFYVPIAGTFKNLRVYVSANTSGGTCTVTVRKNGGSTAITTSYATTVTGLASDTTNTATVAAGDRITVEFADAGGGAGALTVEGATLEFAADATTSSDFSAIARIPPPVPKLDSSDPEGVVSWARRLENMLETSLDEIHRSIFNLNEEGGGGTDE